MLSSFRSSSVKPQRDRHDKYYGDSFTKADANNANGDGLNINADATDERFINDEEINERVKYAARYGFTVKLSYKFLIFLEHLLISHFSKILILFIYKTVKTKSKFFFYKKFLKIFPKTMPHKLTFPNF